MQLSLYCLCDQITEVRIASVHSADISKTRNTFTILERKLMVIDHFGLARHVWQNNIKMDVTNTAWAGLRAESYGRFLWQRWSWVVVQTAHSQSQRSLICRQIHHWGTSAIRFTSVPHSFVSADNDKSSAARFRPPWVIDGSKSEISPVLSVMRCTKLGS
jgi:hypothetical protein